MKVYLNDLYMAKGHEVKRRMQKGDHVEISFENVKALGYSSIQNLKDWASLPNVKMIDLTDYVKGQLKEYLGIDVNETDFNQMTLF